jgi:hypothetical protein
MDASLGIVGYVITKSGNVNIPPLSAEARVSAITWVDARPYKHLSDNGRRVYTL